MHREHTIRILSVPHDRIGVRSWEVETQVEQLARQLRLMGFGVQVQHSDDHFAEARRPDPQVVAICDRCGAGHLVADNGWTAMACHNCGATMAHPDDHREPEEDNGDPIPGELDHHCDQEDDRRRINSERF